MLCCEVFGGVYKNTSNAFTALELIHNGTLIHDDFIDDDQYRRGKNSVHTEYGKKRAVLAGDILLSMSLKYATKTGKISIVEQLSEAAVKMVQGVALQTYFRRKIIPISKYLDLAYLKSGSLFETAAVIGGLLNDIDEGSISRLANFGKNFGIAYQIRDDIVDIISNLDNPIRSDILNGDISLPLIYAVESENISQTCKDLLLKIFHGEKTEFNESEVLGIFYESNAFDKALDKMKCYANESSKNLEGWHGPAIDGLKYLINENYMEYSLTDKINEEK